MSEQKLFILQGASGSGKSTLAAKLAKEHNAIICSTDAYHLEVEGTEYVYRFKADRLGEFHRRNINYATGYMAMHRSVIIDNTNIHAWEAKPYVMIAVALGIPIEFIACTGRYANTHGVPKEVVQRQILEMEHLSVEGCLNAVAPWEVKKDNEP